jgi:hypothetical protein
MDDVSKMDMCRAQLKNNIVVVIELWKNIIFQHVWEWTTCNDVLIKEKNCHASTDHTFILGLFR